MGRQSKVFQISLDTLNLCFISYEGLVLVVSLQLSCSLLEPSPEIILYYNKNRSKWDSSTWSGTLKGTWSCADIKP